MRLPATILLTTFLATTVCPAQGGRPTPPPKPPKALPTITVDSDGDGLPDQRLGSPGFGVLQIRNVDLDDLTNRLTVLFERAGASPILVPHPESKQLIVGGTPDQLESVRKLVRILDVPAERKAPAARAASPVDQAEESPAADFDLQIDGDNIALRLVSQDGGSLDELVRISSPLVGLPIVFDGQDGLFQSSKIHFVGTLRADREQFMGLFQRLVYGAGFGLVQRGGPLFPHLELISLNGRRRTEVTAGARFVAPDQVENYRQEAARQILTIVELTNLDAMRAASTLRPLFAAQASSGSQLITAPLGGQDSGSLLIQGFAPQVVQAVRMLQAAESAAGRDPVQTRVVRLEHRQAADLMRLLNEMFQRPNVQGPQVAQRRYRAVADQGTNSLILSGTVSELEQSTDVIAQLDIPARKD